jgi:small nuclear ribonucleoprotein (snRNP)-like protein
MLLPLQLMEKCRGSPMHIELKNSTQELSGTLVHFSESSDLILSDVTYFLRDPETLKLAKVGEAKKVMVHGTQISLMVPGGLAATS